MTDALITSTPWVAVVVGGLLLLFGRRLFWLFVGVVGFVLAQRLAGAYLGGEAGWMTALVVGVVGAVAAVMVQKVVVSVAGLAAGAVGFLWLAEQFGWPPGLPTLIGVVLAGAVGAALLQWLFELGLVALSALVGAALLVQGLGMGEPRGVALLVLAVVGALVQLVGRRRRRKRDDDG
jgi:uncharacterized membrane protein YeaQ/YmgE (transglycosylase-associated protein family)